jgi:hypothetical protein
MGIGVGVDSNLLTSHQSDHARIRCGPLRRAITNHGTGSNPTGNADMSSLAYLEENVAATVASPSYFVSR